MHDIKRRAADLARQTGTGHSATLGAHSRDIVSDNNRQQDPETFRTAPMPPADGRDKAALVISHPGHELCVHHWLETARPDVFVLTDGSGRSGISRLDSTTKIIR